MGSLWFEKNSFRYHSHFELLYTLHFLLLFLQCIYHQSYNYLITHYPLDHFQILLTENSSSSPLLFYNFLQPIHQLLHHHLLDYLSTLNSFQFDYYHPNFNFDLNSSYLVTFLLALLYQVNFPYLSELFDCHYLLFHSLLIINFDHS